MHFKRQDTAASVRVLAKNPKIHHHPLKMTRFLGLNLTTSSVHHAPSSAFSFLSNRFHHFGVFLRPPLVLSQTAALEHTQSTRPIDSTPNTNGSHRGHHLLHPHFPLQPGKLGLNLRVVRQPPAPRRPSSRRRRFHLTAPVSASAPTPATPAAAVAGGTA